MLAAKNIWESKQEQEEDARHSCCWENIMSVSSHRHESEQNLIKYFPKVNVSGLGKHKGGFSSFIMWSFPSHCPDGKDGKGVALVAPYFFMYRPAEWENARTDFTESWQNKVNLIWGETDLRVPLTAVVFLCCGYKNTSVSLSLNVQTDVRFIRLSSINASCHMWMIFFFP